MIIAINKLLEAIKTGYANNDHAFWKNIRVIIGINTRVKFSDLHTENDWMSQLETALKDEYSDTPFNVYFMAYNWWTDTNEVPYGHLRKKLLETPLALDLEGELRGLSTRGAHIYAISMDADIIDMAGVFDFMDSTLDKRILRYKKVPMVTPGMKYPLNESATWDLSFLAGKLDSMARKLMFDCHPRLPWAPEPFTAFLIYNGIDNLRYGYNDGRNQQLYSLGNSKWTKAEFKERCVWGEETQHITTGRVHRQNHSKGVKKHAGQDAFLTSDQEKVVCPTIEAMRDLEMVSLSHMWDTNFAKHVLHALFDSPKLSVTADPEVRENFSKKKDRLVKKIKQLFNCYHPTSYLINKIIYDGSYLGCSFSDHVLYQQDKLKAYDSFQILFMTQLSETSFSDIDAFVNREINEDDKVKNKQYLINYHRDDLVKSDDKVDAWIMDRRKNQKVNDIVGRSGSALDGDIKDLVRQLYVLKYGESVRLPQYSIDILAGLHDLCKSMGHQHLEFLHRYVNFNHDPIELRLGKPA